MDTNSKNTGLKGMGRRKSYYSTQDIVITVSNTRSVKSKIGMIARRIREEIDEVNKTSGEFIRDMIRLGRFDVHLQLLRIDKGSDESVFIYRMNTVVREQKKVI